MPRGRWTMSFDEYLKRKQAFRDRFEHNEDTGVYKLSSIGCMDRHKIISREDVYLTEQEDRRARLDTPNRAEWEEKRIQNRSARLLSKGFRPLPTESLEEFTERCAEFLS